MIKNIWDIQKNTEVEENVEVLGGEIKEGIKRNNLFNNLIFL